MSRMIGAHNHKQLLPFTFKTLAVLSAAVSVGGGGGGGGDPNSE